MYSNMLGPPIIEYEKVVRPIAIATRSAALDRRDKRDELFKKRKARKRANEEDTEEDKLFEPYIGKLFDYSA